MSVQLSRYREEKSKIIKGQLGNQTFQASQRGICFLALSHAQFVTGLHFKLCVWNKHAAENDTRMLLCIILATFSRASRS